MRDGGQAAGKSELIRRIRDAQHRIAGAIEHLPGERLLEPVMDDWTGKDLLAHMAWWHDHSVGVIEGLRAGRQPYDAADPANTTEAFNEQTHREHLDDPSELTRRAFDESFTRLVAALKPVTDEELFATDHWPWLGGGALAEVILWDSSRHYEQHGEHLRRLSR
ncbi:MAG: ClbS/DfsB family four-helix bundle protein [Candidatus Dormibacteria bacterium]